MGCILLRRRNRGLGPLTPAPWRGIRPRYSELQVQGTASSPSNVSCLPIVVGEPYLSVKYLVFCLTAIMLPQYIGLVPFLFPNCLEKELDFPN